MQLQRKLSYFYNKVYRWRLNFDSGMQFISAKNLNIILWAEDYAHPRKLRPGTVGNIQAPKYS